MFKYSIVRSVHKRAQHIVKDSRINEQKDIEFQNFTKSILKEFDQQRQSGLTDRQAVRASRDKLNKRGHDLTCYQIELIARENGRFRKGFKNAP
jgi:hypothetical protein